MGGAFDHGRPVLLNPFLRRNSRLAQPAPIQLLPKAPEEGRSMSPLLRTLPSYSFTCTSLDSSQSPSTSDRVAPRGGPYDRHGHAPARNVTGRAGPRGVRRCGTTACEFHRHVVQEQDEKNIETNSVLLNHGTPRVPLWRI